MENEPAFPCGESQPNKGLTKREYMASQILSGLYTLNANWDHLVKTAVQLTDKLLEALHEHID